MLSALLDSLGKATRRIFRAESTRQVEPHDALDELEADSTPAPERNLAFDQLEADLAMDLRELRSPHGRAARAHERDSGGARRPLTSHLSEPPLERESRPRSYEASFSLGERAPSATKLFEEARKASEGSPPSPRSPISLRPTSHHAHAQDARQITPQRSLSLIIDEPEDVEVRSSLPPPPVKAPSEPNEVISQRPSATRVTSSSRVLRPDPPPEALSAAPSPLPRRRREGAQTTTARAPAQAPRSPKRGSNNSGDSYAVGVRPSHERRRVNPRLAQAAQAPQQGFEASSSFGLRNMSASQARLTPEQRLAPQLKETPKKIESSAYARFWGSYSATESSINFSSILDFTSKSWGRGWSKQDSEAVGSGLLEAMSSTEGDSMLELLGGRTGYFGDLMDRQWASKLHPKKDAADFAYQESSKFRSQ